MGKVKIFEPFYAITAWLLKGSGLAHLLCFGTIKVSHHQFRAMLGEKLCSCCPKPLACSCYNGYLHLASSRLEANIGALLVHTP